MKTYRILVTGSRNCTKERVFIVRKALRTAVYAAPRGSRIVVVHGGARGVDKVAGEAALLLPVSYIEEYPADWTHGGRSAGPARNQRMVNLGADICLAFPDASSRGKWDCVRRAKEAGIPVKEVMLP